MELEIIRSDELEARAEFSGTIAILYEHRVMFREELNDLITKYAI